MNNGPVATLDAPRRQTRTAAEFSFGTVPVAEVPQLRGRPGNSKYAPIVEAFKELPDGRALAVKFDGTTDGSTPRASVSSALRKAGFKCLTTWDASTSTLYVSPKQ